MGKSDSEEHVQETPNQVILDDIANQAPLVSQKMLTYARNCAEAKGMEGDELTKETAKIYVGLMKEYMKPMELTYHVRILTDTDLQITRAGSLGLLKDDGLSNLKFLYGEDPAKRSSSKSILDPDTNPANRGGFYDGYSNKSSPTPSLTRVDLSPKEELVEELCEKFGLDKLGRPKPINYW